MHDTCYCHSSVAEHVGCKNKRLNDMWLRAVILNMDSIQPQGVWWTTSLGVRLKSDAQFTLCVNKIYTYILNIS